MTKTNGHADGANGADTHSTTHQYITSTSFDLPPPPFKSHSPLKASNLFFSPLPPSKDETTPHAHGRYMLTVPWSRHSGWGQPKIGPRGEISVDPLAGSVQYAVSCFEGMKVGFVTHLDSGPGLTSSVTRGTMASSGCSDRTRTASVSKSQHGVWVCL